MRAWMFAFVGFGLMLSACSDDGQDDDTLPNSGVRTCLDVPGKLDQPPDGKLPCELIPPGLDLSE